MEKTKIIATLGPSSLSEEMVVKMDHLGVDLFRINLSHTVISDLEGLVTRVQGWTDKKICIDTEGAQLRTGGLKNDLLQIDTGESIRIGGPLNDEKDGIIPLNVNNPHEILRVGDLLKIDFDSALVQITDIEKFHLVARVLKGGAVGSNKGIGVDRVLKLPAFTDKDVQAFEIAQRLALDTVFLSFCSSGNDVLKIREYYNYNINVISKIESRLSIANLESICAQSEAVLIDRGDLSRDVPLTKIPFAQSHILDTASRSATPVYVATNLLETMVQKAEPTRAEVHDVVKTLEDGAAGLVLAAEAAIGRYPANCVRVLSNLINEVKNKPTRISQEFLFENSPSKIIPPHGGKLVCQQLTEDIDFGAAGLATVEVGPKIISDIVQIGNGVYSPLDRFMSLEEIKFVLDKNQLLDGTPWTMPIILQARQIDKSSIDGRDFIVVRSDCDRSVYAIIESPKIEEIPDMKEVSRGWFGTEDKEHPGVKEFLKGGSCIISGKVSLVKNFHPKTGGCHELTPRQTRHIFSQNGWANIVGFHTRNVPHRAHEYIQLKALEESNSDAIFISPATGIKKPGDFSPLPIIECYNALIRENFYGSRGAIIGAFDTYSRYCGPREAVFTALCRKNYGCDSFIVGRDHAGVGNYYATDASVRIFDSLDIGINILSFEPVSFSKNGLALSGWANTDTADAADSKSISGSAVRDFLMKGDPIPEYLMRKEISTILHQLMDQDPDSMFQQ